MSKEKLKDKLIRLSNELALEVYPLTLKFPKYETYALGDQLRRAVLSVPTNLIEGFRRSGYPKVLKRYLDEAYGSLGETKYLLYFAHHRGYITDNDYQFVSEKAERLSKLLWAMLTKLKTV